MYSSIIGVGGLCRPTISLRSKPPSLLHLNSSVVDPGSPRSASIWEAGSESACKVKVQSDSSESR